MIVEVCVDGIAAALAAAEGGAHRIELCADLAVGGITPSAGTIAVVCRRAGIPTHVLVRPRGGDFVYNDDEIAALFHDIDAAKARGAAGVVLGVLRPDGTIDAPLATRLIAHAAPLAVTFHKAFDATPDPFEALETLIAIGIRRVLTSGHAPRAVDGLSRLVALVRQAAGRIAIMAGGQIGEGDLSGFRAGGLHEVHVGSAVPVAGQTDVERVRRFVAEATRAEPA